MSTPASSSTRILPISPARRSFPSRVGTDAMSCDDGDGERRREGERGWTSRRNMCEE